MDEKDQKKLQKNWLRLVREVVVDEDLLSFLMSNQILTDNKKEDISCITMKRDQRRALLLMVIRGGPYAFHTFVEGLVETDQDPLADMLDVQIADTYRKKLGKPPEHYPAAAGTTPDGLHIHNPSPALPQVITKETVFTEESIFADATKIQNANPELIHRVISDDISHYKMERNPRGRCIIVNVDKFSKESNKKDREGSFTDVENIKLVFKKLYFEVEIWENKTRDEIVQLINMEKKNEAHQEMDAFVMAVLSHGKEDIIYGIDGGEVQITKDIVQQFSGRNCKGLINKPKVFFIQACQGGSKTKGVVVPDDAGDFIPEEDDNGEILKDDYIHEDADLLVVAGTVPGYKAWRNIIKGSWFISDLTLALIQYSHCKHLEDIITVVTRYVSERSRDCTGHKQVCQKKGQLRRDLYLLPGYTISTS